ncbi:uncharacterized protein Z520_03103 [Fonsecaea multimorphosa CBS 102226]|uniref:RING-type domain-containing protein n=1 Tax=Fonsecaea multimorphosa CBS 102226 TaxID=1442371 RepID=A0A0D2HI13_9EURO|nr:uncharacterized protein Z520_03103 [Fonsecaea multimorphosa CBS 102226]KIY01551.1 hypothetical protein Z520_03103 [Fonsecaea multimorphosa CBS 102226]OAL28065.1 hypothetical protein AYO22_03092 [Fonsecaea multimorphosa]
MAAITEAPATGLLNLENELVCFICTEVLYQPLTLLDCLHTFCGSCLKEWFSHQYRKATHSRAPSSTNPYTCPTCRAPVKNARPYAKINTLLEMFLIANPGRDRTPQEKAEMSQAYKPGEEILPKVENHRRRERRRREEEESGLGDSRNADGSHGERSRHDQHLDPASADRRRATSGNSRSRERRETTERQRDTDRRQRRDQQHTSDTELSRPRTASSSNSADLSSLSPPPSSPRHPEAVEARQRGVRTVAHQASLISLVSASESGTGTGDSLDEARIMQEILTEGLLDGINIDELTEQEQDALSEAIAERIRQLHAERHRRPGSDDSGPGTQGNTPRPPESHAEEIERHARQASRSSNRERTQPSPRSSHNVVIGGNSTRPHTTSSQSANDQLLTLPQTAAHRRRASDESRRGENSATRTDRTPHPAVRSATDLSNRPQSNAGGADRLQQLQQGPHAHRSNTEPRTPPRASEVWQAAGGRHMSSPPQVASPAQQSPRPDSVQPVMSSVATGPVPTSIPTLESEASVPEATELPATSVSTRSDEPSVVCSRCSRPNIQYEVHKHCAACKVDICLRCYRAGRGCNHWFGFYRSAMLKFHASQPPNRNNQSMGLPHLPTSRQYERPSASTAQSGRLATAADAILRLREGNFCDRCGRFANDYFWSCDYCNEGEWGFCNDCVGSNHCCDHPLLPVAYKSSDSISASSRLGGGPGAATLSPYSSGGRDLSPAQSAASSVTSGTGPYPGLRPDFVPLSVTTNCDICARSITLQETRYHCPTHPTPSPENPGQKGDYDICSTCYHGLVESGRMTRDNGPEGWRLCPDGHRMIAVAFEGDEEGNERRIITRGIVGGVQMTDADVAAWKLAMKNLHRVDRANLSAVRGDWSWREDEAGTRRKTRARTSTLPRSGMQLPPDGGWGKAYVARWGYYPSENDGKAKDELMFPKHANIREVEEINDEWWFGVYAGDAGVFPAVFVNRA